MNKILSAKYDVVFKKMFSDANNEDLLKHLLSCMLSIPLETITEVKVTNPEINPEKLDGKAGQMDIKLRLNDSVVNVEMQLHSEKAFKERILYYWAKLYGYDLKEGESYSKLKKTIAISIVNFDLFDCSEYHSVFKLREEGRRELLTDKCEIHFFELTKTSDELENNNLTELWLQLIKADSEEALNMLNNTQVPEIKKAVDVIRSMSEDERVREMVWSREKAMHDEAQRLEDALNEGIAKGRAEGRAEGISEGIMKGRMEGRMEGVNEMIKKMRDIGISEEQIRMIEDMERS